MGVCWVLALLLAAEVAASDCVSDPATVEQLDEMGNVVASLSGVGVGGVSAMAGWKGPWGSVQLRKLPDKVQDGYGHFPNQPCLLPPGTQFRLTCPANMCGLPCSFYIMVYHCPECSGGSNGRYPAILPPEGWKPGSCAPEFQESATGKWHRMSGFHIQVKEGQSHTTPSAEIGLIHVAIFSKTLAPDCSRHLAQPGCTADPACTWANGKCDFVWCPPRPRAQGPGGRLVCTPCASSPPPCDGCSGSPAIFMLPGTHELDGSLTDFISIPTGSYGGDVHFEGWVYNTGGSGDQMIWEFKLAGSLDRTVCLILYPPTQTIRLYTRRNGLFTNVDGVWPSSHQSQWVFVKGSIKANGKTRFGEPLADAQYKVSGTAYSGELYLPETKIRDLNGWGIREGFQGKLRDWIVCFSERGP